jgi:hypothetical protein
VKLVVKSESDSYTDGKRHRDRSENDTLEFE